MSACVHISAIHSNVFQFDGDRSLQLVTVDQLLTLPGVYRVVCCRGGFVLAPNTLVPVPRWNMAAGSNTTCIDVANESFCPVVSWTRS